MKNIAIIGTMVLALGCDENFNPLQDYRPQMVVYGILNTAADTQLVRVYGTYNAPGHNFDNQKEDPTFPGAAVQVSDGARTWSFQQSSVPRWDDGRYSTPVVVFLSPGFRPRRGAQYTISATTSLGIASSKVQVPDSVYAFTNDNEVLASPHTFPGDRAISVRSIISPHTYALFFRLFVDYEVSVPGGFESHTIEIPRLLPKADSLESYVGIYPTLRRRYTPVITDPTANKPPEFQSFSAGVYGKMISMLRNRYKLPVTLNFIRARFVLYQTDEMFYKYINIANGFNDQNSVRTDEPDFTNITNGRGLFAVVASDTVTVLLPSYLGR